MESNHITDRPHGRPGRALVELAAIKPDPRAYQPLQTTWASQPVVAVLDGVSHGCSCLGQFLEAGQCCGKCQKAQEVSSLAVVPDCQSVIPGQPRDRALDHPPVTAETADSIPLRAIRTAIPRRRNPPSQFRLVVRLVGMQPTRPPTPRTPPRPHRRNRHDQRLQRLGVVYVRTRNRHRQRDSRPIGQHVQLRTGLASIRRIRPGQATP